MRDQSPPSIQTRTIVWPKPLGVWKGETNGKYWHRQCRVLSLWGLVSCALRRPSARMFPLFGSGPTRRCCDRQPSCHNPCRKVGGWVGGVNSKSASRFEKVGKLQTMLRHIRILFQFQLSSTYARSTRVKHKLDVQVIQIVIAVDSNSILKTW